MPVRSIKQINIARCLRQLIDLPAVRGTVASGVLTGNPCSLEWGGWQISTDGFVGLDALDMREEIKVASSVGEFRIEKPYPSRAVLGQLSGRAVALHFESGLERTDRHIGFRTFIAAERSDTDLLFPASYHDPAMKFVGQYLLPLDVPAGKVDVFFLKDGPFWVVEMSGEGVTAEIFTRVGTETRRLLTYLTGIRLDSDQCDVEYDVYTEQPLAARWSTGTQTRSSQYTPIPVHYAIWMQAREEFAIQGMQGALVPEAISKCLATYLTNPDLHVAIEYLLAWHHQKVEMRGVFLSVALEALTDHLQKKQLINKEKLLDKVSWSALRDALLATTEASSATRNDDQNKVLRDRIGNLNNATNAQKLKRGFAAFGLNLSPEQEEAIKKRDKFLHEGRILRSEERAATPEPWKIPYQVEMHLFTAISKLLLKYLGYAGPVLNWGMMPVERFEPKFDMI
jgi:hypothetical protein